ncbi:hypothetical protein [Sporosarcina sp. G11-34]|uniref:hypothetical protein n=1 Tax=Sporosarcina sp. G11-34 TaxID=2849605 RepID=UPI0022A8DB00|nr:hypothetical protein [Sporosarcina sp. G11-34]MCZ2260796.1 hypothetical protein [Sporosarcina sp. G11-34]
MDKLHAVFIKNNFSLNLETSKAIEYEHINSKEIVYLLHNKEISIVLNPNMVEKVSLLTSDKKYHSTALKKFPTRKNNGGNPIHYGYSYKFKQASDLDDFLNDLLYVTTRSDYHGETDSPRVEQPSI